jgi:hypothetical protein
LASNPTTGFVEPNVASYPGIGLTTLVADSFASHYPPAVTGTTYDITDGAFGATAGNNAFDNKAAIQLAINNAGAGDEVYIPNGTFYMLTANVALKTGVSIRFQSRSAILRYRNNANATAMFTAAQGLTDIRITGGSIDRDTALAGVVGIPLKIGNGSSGSTSYTAVQRVFVADMALSIYEKYGVLFENVKWGVVWDCDIYLPTQLGGGGQGYGVNVSGPKSEECWIIGNRIGRSGEYVRHGVLVQYTAHNNLIEENICTGFVNDAFDCHGEDEHHNEFRLNEAYEPVRAHASCGTGGCYPAAFGIGEWAPPGPGDHDNAGPYNWVHHNIAVGDWRAGARVNGGQDEATLNTIIENNDFSGADYGIQLGDLAPPGGANFTQVRYNTLHGNGVGIHVVNADDVTIANNHSHDNGTNLLVTTAADRYTIANNCFRRGTVSRPAPGAGSTYTNNAEGNVIDPPALPPPDPYFPGGHLAGGVTYIG